MRKGERKTNRKDLFSSRDLSFSAHLDASHDLGDAAALLLAQGITKRGEEE